LSKVSLSRRELLLAAAAPVFAAPAAPPPNILLIQVDGLGAWTLGGYGNREFRTPNLDILIRSGTRFLQNFSCAPIHGAGSATLLTGRMPGQGTTQGPTLAETLSGRGYNCGCVGQREPEAGYKFYHPVDSAAAASGRGRALEEITGAALEFLDAQKAEQPFLLVVSHYSPAPPYEGLQAKYHEMYAGASFNGSGWQPTAPNAARGKELLAGVVANIRKFAAGLTAVDDQIPPLLGRLEQRGIREKTLIVFASGSGCLLGRHGLWGDALGSEPENMFEEVVGTPMVWNWRGRIPVEGARPESVSLYDFLPSLCEAAGAPAPPGLPGRSYLPAVFGEPFPKNQPWRNLVVAAARNTEMARDARYKLVLRSSGKGPNELYDLRVDPREQVNQYGNPSFVTVRERLTGELAAGRKKLA